MRDTDPTPPQGPEPVRARRRGGARVLAGGIALAVIVGAVVWLRQPAAPPAPAAAAAVPVVAVTAQRRTVSITATLPAHVEAKQSVAVRSRVDGQIGRVAINDGARVKAGQVLFELDPAAINAQAQQARALLARDTAQLAKAEADWNQNVQLSRQGFVSEAALAQVRAALDVARQTVAADQAALQSTQVNLGYTTIRAPFDGVAGALGVVPGQTVRANDTVLVTINQLDPVYVTVAVPESRVGALRQGLAAGPVSAEVNVVGGDARSAHRAQVAFIDNAVDPASGTLTAKLLVQNGDAVLVPGQYVQTVIHLAQRPDVVVLPRNAIQNGPQGRYVWVIDGDRHAAMQPVEVGPETPQGMLIERGLNGGETVVVEGQLRLTPGALVQAAPARGSGNTENNGGAPIGQEPVAQS